MADLTPVGSERFDPEIMTGRRKSSSFAEIRINDVDPGSRYLEMIDLLVENGFDLDIDLQGSGPIKVWVEGREDGVHPRQRLLPSESSATDQKSNRLLLDLMEIRPRWRRTEFLQHRDASLFAYTTGILVAAAFMALSIGPGWLGFFVGFLPASALASWAVPVHA